MSPSTELSFASFAREHRDSLAAVTAGVLIVGGYLHMPSEMGTAADGCTDLEHQLVINRKPSDPKNLSDLAEAWSAERGYTITEPLIAAANPGRNDVAETSKDGLCWNVPAPVISGYSFVMDGQTKSSIAGIHEVTIEQIDAWNPQLTGIPTESVLAAETVVKTAETPDPELVYTLPPYNLGDYLDSNEPLRDKIVAANSRLAVEDGGMIARDSGYFPLGATATNHFYKNHNIEPATVVQTYVEAGAYTVPLTAPGPTVEAVAPVTEAQPAPEVAPPVAETVTSLTLDAVRQMFPHAESQDVEQMYTLVMQELSAKGIDDGDMTLYLFANLAAEVGCACPIGEYYGEDAWYAPYYGRGYIQLTLESNYVAVRDELGIDVVSNPDLALEPANAARIAVWFITRREALIRQAMANGYDMFEMRRLVNGVNRQTGEPNGLARFTDAWNSGYAATHSV